MKKVTVVILNFKLKELVLDCIKSVKNSTFTNYDIVVVDNDSNDELKESLSKTGGVTFIQNKDNLGYSGGNNVGIKYALNHGADFVFILNPDTVIDRKCIEQLEHAAKKLNAGIISPKIYFANSKKLWFAGKIFDKDNVLGLHIGVNEEDKGQYDQIKKMDDATGAALFVDAEVFKRIGFFDEKYFLYYEESDFCFRARKVGIKILYVPSAIVFHENAKATGLGSPIQDYFITRNRMLFASKFLPFRTKFALFREALRNLGNPIRRKAFIDFLRGNFGKGSFIKNQKLKIKN